MDCCFLYNAGVGIPGFRLFRKSGDLNVFFAGFFGEGFKKAGKISIITFFAGITLRCAGCYFINVRFYNVLSCQNSNSSEWASTHLLASKHRGGDCLIK
jgi:hypothetical protein